MPDESSENEPHEFALTITLSVVLDILNHSRRSNAIFPGFLLRPICLKLSLSSGTPCTSKFFADRTRKSFCSSSLMFWNTLFFSFLSFLSSFCLRLIDFATFSTGSARRFLLVFLLFLICLLDPEDDSDDDVSVSESELDDELELELELESKEELSDSEFDDKSESESYNSDDAELDFVRNFLVLLAWGLLSGLLCSFQFSVSSSSFSFYFRPCSYWLLSSCLCWLLRGAHRPTLTSVVDPSGNGS